MTTPTEILEAVRLYKAGDLEQARQRLKGYLKTDPALVNALLWLAKVSPDEREALAAIELALALEPDNEVARRARLVVSERFAGGLRPAPLDVMRITGMTVAQGRAVNWPFRGLHRPIGVLMDEGTIGLNDLGFAVEHAYDPLVKKAATTLLLSTLLKEGLQEPPPPLKVTGVNQYAARMERRTAFLVGAVFAPLVLIVIAMLAMAGLGLYFWVTGQRNLAGWLNLGTLVLAAFAWPVVWWVERQSTSAEMARKGAEGEERFVDALRASLASPWQVFRNVSWPNRRGGDVDLVLVGPGGVWAFEVKAYAGEVRNRGEIWEYKSRRGWRRLSKDPGRQARRNAMNVKQYLEDHGTVPGYIQAVVLWAGEGDALTVEDPATAVWKLSELPEPQEELWQRGKLNAEQIEACSAVLADVIARSEAERAADVAKTTRK